MSISGPSSYLSTMDAFIAHWSRANDQLPAWNPLILAGNRGISHLASLRDDLARLQSEIAACQIHAKGLRADIGLLKVRLLDLLNQFNGKLRSLTPGPAWQTLLPKAFSISEGISRVLPPLEVMAALWTRYLATGNSLRLRGSLPLEAFQGSLADLKARYAAWNQAQLALGLARAARNEIQRKARRLLKLYRLRIPAEFASGSAIRKSLPILFRRSPVARAASPSAISRSPLRRKNPAAPPRQLRGALSQFSGSPSQPCGGPFQPHESPAFHPGQGIRGPGGYRDAFSFATTSPAADGSAHDVTV